MLAAWKVRAAEEFLTPIFWTGYILLIDSGTLRARGRSLLHDERGAFAWMAALSAGLWLIFEAYNLRLNNWRYVGLPANTALRLGGYLWSFATIWPAVLETADFLLAARPGGSERREGSRIAADGLLMACGAVGLAIPLAAPPRWGAYLFGLVWLGFALLLDPLNCRAGRASVLADLRKGERGRLAALLEAGVACGLFWEFWNYWAAAKWVYVFPIGQQVKIFEMPLAGYLGFPAFAVEVFAMYVYASGRLNLPYYEVG